MEILPQHNQKVEPQGLQIFYSLQPRMFLLEDKVAHETNEGVILST